MSKEKQIIEEMAKILEHSCERECPKPINCDRCQAVLLYNAGYRKQEWISVEERLPEDNGDELIICTKDGIVGTGRYNNIGNKGLFSWMANEGSDFYDLGTDSRVTHWMPLPEAPKMKGE